MAEPRAFLATSAGNTVYELEDADTLIGRAESNDIVSPEAPNSGR